jgi:hypothetical protein
MVIGVEMNVRKSEVIAKNVTADKTQSDAFAN